MPGTASIVRDAVISIENGPVLTSVGAGRRRDSSAERCRLPAGAWLEDSPQIHYKKHFDQEQQRGLRQEHRSACTSPTRRLLAASCSRSRSIRRKQATKPPRRDRVALSCRHAPGCRAHRRTPPDARSRVRVAGQLMPSRRPARVCRSCGCMGRGRSGSSDTGSRSRWNLPAAARSNVRVTPLSDYSEEPEGDQAVPASGCPRLHPHLANFFRFQPPSHSNVPKPSPLDNGTVSVTIVHDRSTRIP